MRPQLLQIGGLGGVLDSKFSTHAGRARLLMTVD
jgi:hypothetical protein